LTSASESASELAMGAITRKKRAVKQICRHALATVSPESIRGWMIGFIFIADLSLVTHPAKSLVSPPLLLEG
jgi:hypothetical protein